MGRPKGSKNKKYTGEVERVAARCIRCHSSGFTILRKTRDLDHKGIGPDGKPYTRIIWRRIQCKSCGQVQMDKEYSYQSNGKKTTRSTVS